MRTRWHIRVNALVVGWLLAAAAVAVAHRWVPAAPWLMTHMLLLGAASTAILIWSAHFGQAVRRRPLRGGHRDEIVRLALHTLGAVAVMAGLLMAVWPVVVAGAVLVVAVAVWHTVVLVDLGRGAALGGGLGWTTWYFVASAAALPLGGALGVLMARPDTAGDVAARAHLGHVAVTMLGWVGLAVVGTLVTLWPTMLRVGIGAGAVRTAQRGLVVLGSGLVLVVVGAGVGQRLLGGAGLAVYLVGLLLVGRHLLALARVRRPETFAAWSVGSAALWLAGIVAVWAVLVATAASWTEVQTRTSGLLGPLAVGFCAQVLLGSLSHLVPMVMGGGPTAVREARAVTERGGSARLVLVNGGLLLAVLPAPSLVRVGLSVLVLAALTATPVLLVRSFFVSRRLRADIGAPQTVAVGALTERTRPARRAPAIAAAAALVLVVVGGVAADPAAVGLGTSAAGAVAPTGRVVEIAVEARDMRFEPASVEVAAGDELVLVVTNVDDAVHDLVLDSGASSGRLAAGATTRVEVGVVGRAMAGWCSVAGHRQMGMVFDVDVIDGQGADTAGDGTRTAHDDAGASAAAEMDLRGEPGRGFVPYDPVLPPASDDTVHRVTLEVAETEREVAPGVRQTLWTFGGSAPGPVLRGRVGDTFEITLVNDGSIGHSIDFHAGALAPTEPMRTIEPGSSLTYTFTATRSGIWMYHCSTMPMSLHIANGMFGAVVIDPPDLPEVDREYLVVQSELYLGPQGGTADAARVAVEEPDAVVFNGYAGQYDHAPLEAEVGERVRIWVLDAGPNRPSAFHVVGGQFDTTFLEGAWTLGGPGADPAGTGGAQVLGLLPAQGGFVEVVFPEAGEYPFVSHLMVDAERGAHGLVSVQ
jgi:nitrite reductase (NO-forming)